MGWFLLYNTPKGIATDLWTGQFNIQNSQPGSLQLLCDRSKAGGVSGPMSYHTVKQSTSSECYRLTVHLLQMADLKLSPHINSKGTASTAEVRWGVYQLHQGSLHTCCCLNCHPGPCCLISPDLSHASKLRCKRPTTGSYSRSFCCKQTPIGEPGWGCLSTRGAA